MHVSGAFGPHLRTGDYRVRMHLQQPAAGASEQLFESDWLAAQIVVRPSKWCNAARR